MIAEAAGLRVRLKESMEIVEHALGQVRDLSLNLRPSLLDDLGLGAALRWFVDRLALRLPIEVSLRISVSEERMPTEIETACFRVAQEALTNVTRHANASRIEIAVQQTEGWLDLTIRDDGQGFDVREARERAAAGSSLGLPGMEERAVLVGGRLSVESTPGQGTTLHALFPLHCAWPRATEQDQEQI
jgi:signal transduction histidine kinase